MRFQSVQQAFISGEPTRIASFNSSFSNNFLRKTTVNVMRLYEQSYDRSNLIGTFLYHNLSRGWFSHPSPDLPNLKILNNLLNQSFESIF